MSTLAPPVTHRDKKGRKFISITETAYDKAGLSNEEAQRVNEASGISNLIRDFIEQHRYPNQYAAEKISSNYVYPDGYEVRPIEEQIEVVSKTFGLNPTEALAYAKTLPELPEGAEGWFAIRVASTYNYAVEAGLDKLGESRKFHNYRNGELSEKYLRQSQRSIDMWDKLQKEQAGDIIIIPAQFGMGHRGKSVRRARETFVFNEFGLGVFATACMLITHPNRLQKFDELGFDCSGDEYNWDAAGYWSYSPYFYFTDGGVGLSASGVECVDEYFGSASAFLLGSVAT